MNTSTNNTQHTEDTSQGKANPQLAYAFRDKQVLPLGAVRLRIVKGDAWVFTEKGNFIMHSGDERSICTHHAPPSIRSAYDIGVSRYMIVNGN